MNCLHIVLRVEDFIQLLQVILLLVLLLRVGTCKTCLVLMSPGYWTTAQLDLLASCVGLVDLVRVADTQGAWFVLGCIVLVRYGLGPTSIDSF